LESGDTIAAGGILTLYRSTFGFALNNTGNETVTLTKPGGAVSDTQTYSRVAESSSYSKIDGTWATTTTPTPDRENILTSSSSQQDQDSKSSSQENDTTIAKTIPTGPFEDIILTEILANPEGSDTEGEFIELYNPSEKIVDLSEWTLHDASASGKHTIQDLSIQPRSYSVIYRAQSKIALNNSGSEDVLLRSPDEQVKSETTYTSATEGISLSFNQDAGTWTQTTTPTPGKENIFTQNKEANEVISGDSTNTDTPNEILAIYPDIIISEILPNPDEESEFTEEFIELYNPNDVDISLDTWILKDGSKSGKYTFGDGDHIAAGAYLVVEKPTFTFALNNSGEEFLTLIAPNENEKDQVSYDGTTKGISLIRGELKLGTPLVPAQTPTPGSSNTQPKTQEIVEELDSNISETILGTYPSLILSEILANPDAESGSAVEYIELYNPNESIVD